MFLDRDGVLNIPEFRNGRSYAPRRVEDFVLYPDAPQALRELAELGCKLIVVTNQPDVGNGLVERTTVSAMHDILRAALPVHQVLTCPHSQTQGCGCRKPKPGMLLAAAEEWNLDLARCYVIGDRAGDILAGRAAGCATVFIDRGYTEPKPEDCDFSTDSLSDAAQWFCRRVKEQSPRDRQTGPRPDNM